ncbi:thiol-disulfide oxidoreductase DCC family protein [Oceanobacillus sp. CAU 1775]
MDTIVLFDGECNFCDSSVQFIIRRDPKETFKFASLQSDLGIELREKFQTPDDMDSLVLIENNNIYYKSTAALRIAKHLKGLWKLSYIFTLVPRSIRDVAYNIIAKNRIKWFGTKNSCTLPTPETRSRFL